jgi:hypothetical protein
MLPRYTNATRPIVGMLDETTLANLIRQLQNQWPALFNLSSPGFFNRACLGATPPRLVIPICCAEKVLQAARRNIFDVDMAYLATRLDLATFDLSSLPVGLAELLKEVHFCLQVETITINLNPTWIRDNLATSLRPLMSRQCFAVQARLWVGMATSQSPVSAQGLQPEFSFSLDVQAVGEFRLTKPSVYNLHLVGPDPTAKNSLLVEVNLRGIEIIDLKPEGLESMIKYTILRAVADLIARYRAELVLPADWLSIGYAGDVLYTKEENTDQPSLFLRASFGTQTLPSGPGSPEIDHNFVRIVLTPDYLSEEVL